MTESPPRLALRLLAWRVPEPDREYLIGDLLEAFAELQAHSGAKSARRWFWRETIQLLVTRWPASPRVDPETSRETSMFVLNSVRVAARSLTRAPVLSTLVILTLALGIGATASVYSVARAALFLEPPYPNSQQVVLVWERDEDGDEGNVGHPTFEDLSRENVFASTAAMSYWMPTISNGSEITRLAGQRVTWQFFDVLGVKPMLGRSFLPEEDRREANRVLVLSYNLWRSRFGSDSTLVGRDIQVNGTPYRVAGVMPQSFESLITPGTELWAPLGYDATLPWACRTCRHLRMVARLREGVSLSVATQTLDAAQLRLKEQFPTEYSNSGTLVTPVHEYVVRATRPALIALLAAVGIVALIACFNAANLLLGRALRREGEFALRVALGASHGRLTILLLSEGLLLAFVAGALGIILAVFGVDILVALAPASLPRLDQIRVDTSALLFALGLALFTGLAASAVPAYAMVRAGLHESIRSGTRSVGGGGRHRLRQALVAAEVALAVMLVSGTSLLLGSVTRLLAVDGGFATRNRVTMELDLRGPAFTDSGRVEQAWQRVTSAVQAVPGVRSVALSSLIPLGGNYDMYAMRLEDRAGGNPADDPSAMRYAVTPGYFETMGIPIKAGRAFTDADRLGAPGAILLNEAAAQQLYPAGNAVGHRIKVLESRPYSTIVGIVGNTLHQSMDAPQEMQMYLPTSQWGEESGMTLIVHTSVRSESAIRSIQDAVRRAVPGIAISKVATLDQLLAGSTANRRFALALFAAFAAVALLLATAGLYGVLSATVVERTREIGVRTALGAPRGRILGLVLRQGMVLTGLGLAVGLFATWGSTRIISTLLFGIGASDPVVLMAVISSLGAAALLACALPAWKASRVDPVIALRDG